MNTSPWTTRSSRIIVRSSRRKDIEQRVREMERRGFTAVTGIIEDIGYDGDMSYVCIMEKKKEAPQS